MLFNLLVYLQLSLISQLLLKYKYEFITVLQSLMIHLHLAHVIYHLRLAYPIDYETGGRRKRGGSGEAAMERI